MLVALEAGRRISQQAITSLDSPKLVTYAPGAFELPPPCANVGCVPFYAMGDETYTT